MKTQHPTIHRYLQEIVNTFSQNISDDFMNRKDRHDNDFISFKVKYQNVYTHEHIPSVVKWALPESTFANLAWLQYQSD